jgi:hypothetical protein
MSIPASSSIHYDSRSRAAEIRFVVDTETARRVRAWIRERLDPDPHGGGAHGDEYVTTTLYFDTEERAVFHREGSYGRSKYRIRRYEDGALFLERKLRTARHLSKRRTAVDAHELLRLAESHIDPAWRGTWFHARLRARRLAPVSQIRYQRTARVGDTSVGVCRFTIDEDVRALPARAPVFAEGAGVPVCESQAIIELKYRIGMPAVFKQLVEAFALEPARVSKYRLAAAAIGDVPS